MTARGPRPRLRGPDAGRRFEVAEGGADLDHTKVSSETAGLSGRPCERRVI